MAMAAFSVIPTSTLSTLAVHNIFSKHSAIDFQPQAATDCAAVFSNNKFRSSVHALPIRIQLQTPFTKGAGNQDLFSQKFRASLTRIQSGSRSGGALLMEANVFARAARIFRAFIGGVVSSNEDPERLLEQATEEMGGDLARLRQTSAQVKNTLLLFLSK